MWCVLGWHQWHYGRCLGFGNVMRKCEHCGFAQDWWMSKWVKATGHSEFAHDNNVKESC